MPARPDNPDGFWENLRFVALNDEALNVMGAAWDLPPREDQEFNGSDFQPLEAKARLLIETFPPDSTWGWKDPRNCLTLPFWRRLLPELKMLIIVRNPLEVAYSMHRRNGTSYALALRLWELYNRRVLRHARPEARLITRYQAFFERPEAELRRILPFMGLSGDTVSEAAAIVAKDHRHTSFTIEQLIDAGASLEIVTLYRSLIDEGETAATGLSGSGKVRRADDESLSLTSLETPDPLAGATESLNLAVLHGETARRELAWRRGAEIQHERTIEQLKARIETFTLEIGRRDGRITELQAAYGHLDKLLLHERAERDKLLAELTQAREESRPTREAMEELRSRFIQTNRLLHSYSLQLEEREQKNFSLNERLRKQLIETRRLVRLLEDIERAAERLRTSRRWIIGNFFGWLVAKVSGRPMAGFGHLDRDVTKYRAWRKANPEIDKIEDAIAALRPRQLPPVVSFPDPSSKNHSSSPVTATPSLSAKPIRFPRHQKVIVSVIIPVFNQVAFTQACLNSIQELVGDIPFEVIVVDDASTDATADMIGFIPGLVYLRNDSNLGFIASCNRGAGVARGEYLLFLNNDTVVTTGWLDILLQTFEWEPEAGLVGSKLVFPDGRLQEAGGIIWRDGSGWNRGKFDDPEKPEYNYLREIDYCSGASIMITKALFSKVGGFDSKFAPAYYEDVDLCFKLRRAGYKIFYQPLSEVIHFEGGTGGTDTSSGTKRYQEVNCATFRNAWADLLATKPENGDLGAYYRLPPGRQRILVIDHHLPMPDRDAGSLRMFNILVILARLGHRVTFVPDNLADIPPYADELQRRGVEVIYHPYLKSVREYLGENGDGFNTAILSRCDFAARHIAAVRRYAPQSRIVFDTVDLHFLRQQREADLTADPLHQKQAQEKKRQEYQVIEQADETWVVSGAEQQLLRSELPHCSIELMSMIVDVPGSATPFSLRHDFLFIGSFQHTPNVDAVLFFANEIQPLIRQKLPDTKFYVIGDKAPPSIIALASENIVITGLVPDVKPYFDSVKLSVAPLRYGAGIKGKMNQSMGLGVPVVATSMAVEGMALTHRHDVMVADDPRAFADAVIELYESEELWSRLSKNALAVTKACYSEEAARVRLAELFSESHLRVVSPPLPEVTPLTSTNPLVKTSMTDLGSKSE